MMLAADPPDMHGFCGSEIDKQFYLVHMRAHARHVFMCIAHFQIVSNSSLVDQNHMVTFRFFAHYILCEMKSLAENVLC